MANPYTNYLSIRRMNRQKTSKTAVFDYRKNGIDWSRRFYRVRLVLSGEFQGTESLWLNSKLSVVVGPSRDGSLGVIGVSDMTSLKPINY
jgi:hypothetical protein